MSKPITLPPRYQVLRTPNTLSRNASVEFLNPPFPHPSRQSSLSSSIFSLVSTIIGGGVLSLPYAFSQCGLLFSFVFLAVIALASDFSIYILISASRRQHGSTSYPNLIRSAFGPRASTLCLILLFALVYTAVVAYLILLRDMVGPLVEWLSGPVGLQLSVRGDQLCFLLVVCCLTRLCLLRSLHGLRYASVLSVATVCALGVVIVMQASRSNAAIASLSLDSFLYPPSLPSLLSCAPIMVNTFLCHFNVLPVHSTLSLPTRRRIHTLVHAVVTLSFALYAIIGSAGFLLYGQAVDANIMNNMRGRVVAGGDGVDGGVSGEGESDWVRLGLVVTLCCNLPLLVLPCRDTAMQLLGWAKPGDDEEYTEPHTENDLLRPPQQQDNESDVEDSPLPEETPLIHPHAHKPTNGKHAHYSLPLPPSVSASASPPSTSSSPYPTSPSPPPPPSVQPSSLSLVWVTLVLIASSVVLSLCIPSVALLWSVLGSTVSIWVAFTLPSLAYLRVRRRKGWTFRRCGSLLLLCVSAVMCVACGWTAVKRFSSGRGEQVLEVGGTTIDE